MPALQDTGTFTDEGHPEQRVKKIEAAPRQAEPEKVTQEATFPLSEDDILRWAGEIAKVRLAEKRAALAEAIKADEQFLDAI
jgi:hypothetical protein